MTPDTTLAWLRRFGPLAALLILLAVALATGLAGKLNLETLQAQGQACRPTPRPIR
jgi:hypothetical protein